MSSTNTEDLYFLENLSLTTCSEILVHWKTKDKYNGVFLTLSSVEVLRESLMEYIQINDIRRRSTINALKLLYIYFFFHHSLR